MKATSDNLPVRNPSLQPTQPELVRIFDTTLRDGEQSPGASLTADEKLQIAEQLAKLGVDVIEAGFPVSSPGDMSGVQKIAGSVGQAKRSNKQGAIADPPGIAAMARANRTDIDSAWRGVREAIHPRIHSAGHQRYSYGIQVAQDTARSDRDGPEFGGLRSRSLPRY